MALRKDDKRRGLVRMPRKATKAAYEARRLWYFLHSYEVSFLKRAYEGN